MVVFQATKCFRVPLYICGASNSEQLINTELRQDKGNQVLTKALTKTQKH